MGKKLMGLLFCILFGVLVLPVKAFAGSTGNLQTLLDNATEGTTVTLTENYDGRGDSDYSVKLYKNVTIDLHGHTIENIEFFIEDNSSYPITDLTITDSTEMNGEICSTQYEEIFTIRKAVNLTISSGVTIKNVLDKAGSNGRCISMRGGALTINDSIITGNSPVQIDSTTPMTIKLKNAVIRTAGNYADYGIRLLSAIDSNTFTIDLEGINCINTVGSAVTKLDAASIQAPCNLEIIGTGITESKLEVTSPNTTANITIGITADAISIKNATVHVTGGAAMNSSGGQSRGLSVNDGLLLENAAVSTSGGTTTTDGMSFGIGMASAKIRNSHLITKTNAASGQHYAFAAAPAEITYTNGYHWRTNENGAYTQSNNAPYVFSQTDTYVELIPVTLSFSHSPAYDVPTGPVNSDISPIDVSTGVSSGTPGYTFSLEDSPSWLTITSAGILTGMRPGTNQAETTAKVRVSDNGNPVSSQVITIAVGAVTGGVGPTPPPKPIPKPADTKTEQSASSSKRNENGYVNPLAWSYADGGDESLCTIAEQGKLCKAAFALATPKGYREAFSFNLSLRENGEMKTSTSKKNGRLTLYIPKEYQKQGRDFMLIGINKYGGTKHFADEDISDMSITAAIELEGYAFSLIYKDSAITNQH